MIRSGGNAMKTGRVKGLAGVAETLLIPLCYRAAEARQPLPLIIELRAQEMIDQLGVDLACLKWRPSQQVFAMLRARQFDRWTRIFLANHRECTVIEIGCGLDARFERVDDSRVKWVDMDLPEVIDLRRQFFRDTNRRQMLGQSVFNLSWLSCIPAEGAHLFLAEGVFPYFNEAEVRRVFLSIAGAFPGSELIVDGLSPVMVHSSAVVPMFRGCQARPRWGMSDPQIIEKWGSTLTLLENYGYFDQPEPRLASARWMARIRFFHDLARILRIRLGKHHEQQERS
jgi:O-methyltransferase involved in polyketide biosynthesis